ncbi:MAG: class I SAM-dependent methyltransferase [Leptospirales bacterium]
MTFRDFMARALADPLQGYYTRNAKIGFDGGDFYTAPEISPAFALLLTHQIIELDKALNHPPEFYLMEAGPGNGTLMRDILMSAKMVAPSFFSRIRPVLFEVSPRLKEIQVKKLGSVDNVSPVWVDGSSPNWEMLVPFEGMILGNEFLDAMPVHRLRKTPKGICEIYIEKSTENSFQEIEGDLSDRSLIEGIHTPPKGLPDGFEWEVETEMCRIVSHFDRILERGFMLWIDYGDSVQERFSSRRSKGTVMGYRSHEVVEDILSYSPGSVDLTVHVDFPLLAGYLSSIGYKVEGFTDQMSFLTNLGMESLLSDQEGLSEDEKSRMMTLIHPFKMGQAFKVILLSKGKVSPAPWTGFQGAGLPWESLSIS